jgi:hypothetical protein
MFCVKKNGIPVRTDWVPTPRLARALREPERGLVKMTYEEAVVWSRRVYERARKR